MGALCRVLGARYHTAGCRGAACGPRADHGADDSDHPLFSDNDDDVDKIRKQNPDPDDQRALLAVLDTLSRFIPKGMARYEMVVQRSGTSMDIKVAADYDIPASAFTAVCDACKDSEIELLHIYAQPNHFVVSIIAKSPIVTSAYAMRKQAHAASRADRRPGPYSRGRKR